MAGWREELHPRDAGGRFARKGSLAAVSIKRTMSNLAMASEDDLFDVAHRVAARRNANRRDLEAIDRELARREGKADLDPPDESVEARKIDDLVSRGWSYADAYSEAYGTTAGRVTAAQESALLDRKKGETLEQARRRAYREMVSLQRLQAEEATRGNMTSKRCPGVDPVTLWSAAPARARKCASEELARWWEQNGGRRTYAEWKAQLGTSRRTAKADAARLVGAGKDFGL
jgi:hypothetical protein